MHRTILAIGFHTIVLSCLCANQCDGGESWHRSPVGHQNTHQLKEKGREVFATYRSFSAAGYRIV